jgi:hypothetical protein
MKLSTLIVVALGLWLAAASAAHTGKKVYGQIDLPQYQGLPVGMWMDNVCAASPSTHINVNHLRWTLRRHDSKLKLMPGMPANCRRYYAPVKTTGWDRVTVTYRFGGVTYVGQTNVFHIIPQPQRP